MVKITSVRFTFGKPKKKLSVGDTKVIKGVLHTRQRVMAHDAMGRVIGYNCTGGRQNYEWVPNDCA